MSLSEFMNSISLFEVVDYSKAGRTEVCLGRVKQGSNHREEDAWFNMIAQTLSLQIQMKVEAVSFSKQYMLKGDALVYLWKIACKDLEWLKNHMPRIDKTLEWQREAVFQTGLQEGERGEIYGRMSLPGVRGKLEMGPQPEDIGAISDAKAENR
jgi:hypothetical protein